MKRLLLALMLIATTLSATAQEPPPAHDAPPAQQAASAAQAAPTEQATPAGQAGPGTATILYKSTGDALHAFFRTSTSPDHCADLTRVAGVYDADFLRKKLLGFVAKTVQMTNAMQKVYSHVETTVQADVPLQLMGYSAWTNTSAQLMTYGTCGPFTKQFTPVAGRKYQALFTFYGGTCSMSMQDITDSAAPGPVETKPLNCKL